MTTGKTVQLASLSAASYNLGLVLMVHHGWRLWQHIGSDEFPAYHRAWWFGRDGLQPILWPGVAVHALGSIAQLGPTGDPAPKSLRWAVLGLQATSGLLTAVWWGRGQSQLQQATQPDGSIDPRYERLLKSHWLRVGLIAAAAACQFAITRQAFPPTSPNPGSFP